jgi:ATP-dependent Clp protease ATP-binding subunit ClpC
VGYEKGGNLTEIVRRKPFSVILLDEIEKAHPDVFNSLLQIMEDGRLTDSKGRTVDFKNTIIIMTSNLGSDLIRKAQIGFDSSGVKSAGETKTEVETKVFRVLKDSFKPEFLNRIDEIVIFSSLSKDDISKISDKMLDKTRKLLAEHNLTLEIDKKAKDYIAEHGYNDEYGARPLRRLIQKEIENVLSSKMISGELVDGDKAKVTLGKSGLKIEVEVAAKV